MNKKKIKLLIANDAHYLGTGYGVYGKELLTRLHNSGKYEIAELACYATLDTPEIKKAPWTVYPNAPSSKEDPKIIEFFKKNNVNQFGLWRFDKAVLNFKPDIVFDIRDYWMYSYQEISPLRDYFRWVIMPTVDSSPQKEEWLYTFSNADMVVPYTDWAKQTLINQCGENINLFPKIANAGVDTIAFKPIKNKKNYQKQIFGKDVSITGLVMRNQKRKLFPDIIKAYQAYLSRLISENQIELYNKSFLYLHTSYPEQHGWDFPSILVNSGILDKIYFTYICKNCKAVYPAKFSQSICKCKECNQNSLAMPNANFPVPTEKLIEIYNLFDLYVQYAICEGFGMPQVEAASCGIPIASVEYSAMTEIVNNLKVYPIPVVRMFREMETNADRAYPDIDKTTDILYHFFVNKTEDQRNNMSKMTRKLCKQYYSWDDVYKVWDDAFQSIDLSKNANWSENFCRVSNYQNAKVPSNLSPTDFIDYICLNIINDPKLLKTAFIKGLKQQFTTGVFAVGGALKAHSYQSVTQVLQSYLNQKLNIINIYENRNLLEKEDFLNVN